MASLPKIGVKPINPAELIAMATPRRFWMLAFKVIYTAIPAGFTRSSKDALDFSQQLFTEKIPFGEEACDFPAQALFLVDA